MERRLKERLIGAAVLVLLAVIFIPMLLNDTTEYNSEITSTNIPSRPEDEFSSRVVPLNHTPPEQKQALPEDAGAGETENGEKVSDTGPSPPLEEVTEPVETPAGGGESDTAAPPDKNMGVQAWIVQLGSFSSEKNAQNLNERLRKQGFTAFVEPLKQKTSTIYRVRVGPELLRSDAEEIRNKIKTVIKMDGLVVPYP